MFLCDLEGRWALCRIPSKSRGYLVAPVFMKQLNILFLTTSLRLRTNAQLGQMGTVRTGSASKLLVYGNLSIGYVVDLATITVEVWDLGYLSYANCSNFLTTSLVSALQYSWVTPVDGMTLSPCMRGQEWLVHEATCGKGGIRRQLGTRLKEHKDTCIEGIINIHVLQLLLVHLSVKEINYTLKRWAESQGLLFHWADLGNQRGVTESA